MRTNTAVQSQRSDTRPLNADSLSDKLKLDTWSRSKSNEDLWWLTLIVKIIRLHAEGTAGPFGRTYSLADCRLPFLICTGPTGSMIAIAARQIVVKHVRTHPAFAAVEISSFTARKLWLVKIPPLN